MIQLVVVIALLSSVFCEGGNQNIEALTQDLQGKLDRYRNDLGVLQKQVSSLKTQLQASQGQSALSITQLQQGLANERDILNTVQGYLNLPFNISRCECFDLSDSERVRVLAEIKSIKQKLTVLESNEAFSQTCPQAVEIHKQFLRERRYILNIEQTLTSKACGQRPKKQIKVQITSGLVDLAQSEYQTNLRAKNWCYGKLTEQQVKLLWFAFTVKNNVTNCPISIPYFDGQKCFNCEAPNAFFDLSLKRCINAQSVDANKQCVGIGSANKQQQANDTSTIQQESGPTYKDVTVAPLEADPIIKSITFNKQKKTVDKIVQPIQGKAILDKQKTLTNTNYVQVQPQVADPLVKIRRVKKRSSSSKSSSSSYTKSGGSASSSSRSWTNKQHQLWQM